MSLHRLLLVGHDEPEALALKERLDVPLVWSESLPRIRLWAGGLEVESPRVAGRFLGVQGVVFHGIFEDDLPFLSALCLWGGPVYPRPRGMLDCRLRLPCLVKALEATAFGTLARGFVSAGAPVEPEGEVVAKWGNWHCGEDKERFRNPWTPAEPALLERFVEGEAVRVQLIGQTAWQFRLGGEGWKKSIHGSGAALMPQDKELVEDARRLQRHFGLDILGVDYVLGRDGGKHLLEVNHIPSVTAFAEVREAYLEEVVRWVEGLRSPPYPGSASSA